jgi:serine/threonine protein phosphatase PrpC
MAAPIPRTVNTTQPSATHEIELQVVGRTDIGNVRPKNEDSFVVTDLTGRTLIDTGAASGRFDVGERGVLLAVSDGMGGERAGEVASALVVHTLARAMRATPASTPSEERLHEAVKMAHEKVWKTSQEEHLRMGATLTAIYVHGKTAWIAEVGDSRAYLVRAGKIAQLTKDQSVVQRLLDTGALSPEEAAHSPFRGTILQAMGHQPDVGIALGRIELRARDCLVICSDGLTTHLSDEDIGNVVLSSRDLGAACDELVDLANSRGGYDNITVVLGGVDGPIPAPRESRDGIEQTLQVLQSFG